MKESEREDLRKLVDDAKRSELERERQLRRQAGARSSEEVKRQTANTKAILEAQLAHDPKLEPLAIVAQAGHNVYLVSVGAGLARVLDLGENSPSLSTPENIYAVMVSSDAEWLPFEGDSDAILAVAARMIEAAR